ncbi:MFS transporter [Ravibacter arvi]|uniref:MFS transporter n=1 Tax=Ravibacter arvi TaxID=2051041 RepID=A0ABP8MA21_9BACT
MQSEHTRPPLKAWLILGMLCVVGCLNYIDRIMITTMRGSIMEAMPMTDAQFGLLSSVFLWVYGVLSPFAGFLADKFKRSQVIIVSLFVWSAVTWLTAHAGTYGELLLTRALMGVSEACYMPAALALIADYHRGPTRSLATGIHMMGVGLGQSLGFVGGALAEQHDWTYAFSLFGGIGIGFAFLLAFGLRDAPKQKTESAATKEKTDRIGFRNALEKLFGRKEFLLILLFWGLLGVVAWLIVGWLPTFYKERFGLSQGTAGLYATGYINVMAMAGVLLGGFLADRWSKVNRGARILVPAIGMLVAAPAVFVAGYAPVLWLAVGGFMLYGLTKAFTDANMMPVLCMVADERYRATGYGVLNMCSCIVGGIGLYAGGSLRDADVPLGLIFQSASGLMLVCAVLMFGLNRRLKKGG